MVTIILAIALLVALTGLGIEIGVTSWSLCRANRYQWRKSTAERTKEQAISARQDMAKRMESLDDYASKISWLLNFLYNRYNKFADLETEVQEGLKGVTEDTPIGEADGKYKDLKRALEIIRVTMKASEHMESLMNPATTQISQVIEDFRDEEDEKPEALESSKPTKSKAEGSSESKTPDVEVLNF
jgi:hypothetical protein